METCAFTQGQAPRQSMYNEPGTKRAERAEAEDGYIGEPRRGGREWRNQPAARALGSAVGSSTPRRSAVGRPC